jgi:PKD repeat protein
VTRGLITSVVTVGCLALVLAVEATAAPTPIFTVNGTLATGEQIPVVAGEEVRFASNSTGIGAIVNVWDLDGDVSTGPEGFEASGTAVTHTFPCAATPSTVNVRLRVTDEDEDPLARTVTTPPQPIVVNPPTPPAADFSVSPTQPVPGATATFTSTASDVPGCPITSIDWDFGNDGTFDASGPTAATAFTSGSHRVHLRVQYSGGLSADAFHDVLVNAPPVADFTAFPTSPLVGEEVNLTSDSSDDGGLAEQLWDLDGDGAFDDASGSRAKLMFTAPGNHTVSLLVRDGHGATSRVSKVINARRSTLLQPITNQPGSNSPPAKGNPAPSAGISQPVLRLISPFPVVRLTGSVVKRGTRVRRLSVRAPAGSKVFVRCRGRGCPVKRAAKLVKRSTVRVRAFERLLRPGTLLEVLVRRGDQMGKYTSFRIRPKRVPKRIDGCLPPSASRGVTCQAD